jgi:hypothetical protein
MALFKIFDHINFVKNPFCQNNFEKLLLLFYFINNLMFT